MTRKGMSFFPCVINRDAEKKRHLCVCPIRSPDQTTRVMEEVIEFPVVLHDDREEKGTRIYAMWDVSQVT